MSLLAAAAVVVIGGGVLWRRAQVRNHAEAAATDQEHAQAGGQDKAETGRSGARSGASDRPVSVLVATGTTRDVPIYLEGLGSVTAYKTVNVHTLVEGRLVRVGFKEGDTVHKGSLLAEVDPRPFTIQLHQAEAALERDEAQLHGAERNLERYAAVSAERLIPQQQTDDQRTLVEQLRGTVASDRAQIESARLMLDYARITSPIDGVTGVRQVDPGNLVHVADATGIVVVTQIDPIAVLFTLPQDDLPRVAAAQAKGPLLVDALTRDESQSLATGRVELIDNQINQTTATIRLKAIFPNPNRILWPNQFVSARLHLDTRTGVLVIPAVAVQRGPQGSFVYVATSDDRADQRPVVVESVEGDQAILSRGVSAGERVIIEGQSQLRPGARIVIRDGSPRSGAAGAGGADRTGRRSGGSGHQRSATAGAGADGTPGGGTGTSAGTGAGNRAQSP